MSKTFLLYATSPEDRREESRQAHIQLQKEEKEQKKEDKKRFKRAVRARRAYCKEHNLKGYDVPLERFLVKDRDD